MAKKSERLFCSPYLKNVLNKELFCLIVVKVVLGEDFEIRDSNLFKILDFSCRFYPEPRRVLGNPVPYMVRGLLFTF